MENFFSKNESDTSEPNPSEKPTPPEFCDAPFNDERKSFLKKNIENVLEEIKNGNNLGEKITVVGAAKFVDIPSLQYAVDCGITVLGDNKVQEFRDKTSAVNGAEFHFIGRLQKNKVKYLVGKVSTIHSVDSNDLLDVIDRESAKKNVITNVLIELNLGEGSKTGFGLAEALNAAEYATKLKNVRLSGVMAMLPKSDDEDFIQKLCLQVRSVYDTIKKTYGDDIKLLSLGMSNDYRIAIKNGSNVIRLGTCIFGRRNYDTVR